MCEVGIFRPYISDHNAIFCVLYDTTVFNDQHSCIKRNFCSFFFSQNFGKYLTNEAWANIYYSGTQEVFTEFQEIINTYFDKSFNKEVFTLIYKNCYPWMTNSLRNKLKLGFKALKHLDAIELNRHYRKKINELISELRNIEIIYYSNQFEIHKQDSKNSWKILKTIIGKKTHAIQKE